MKKYKILPEKLKNYSLFAGSILTSAFAAQGQVVYTDVVPDKELGGTIPASYPDIQTDSLDLNNDGQFDFKISLNINDTLGSGFSFREEMEGINNPSNQVGTYTQAYIPFAAKKDAGDSIPFINWFGFVFGNFAFQYPLAFNYYWDNVQDTYVGLRVKIGSDNHYGWVRLDVNTADTVPNIIIKGYAYEQTPNKKIAAGDTGFAVGSPELSYSQNQLSVFPNPSHGTCVIKLNQPVKEEIELSVKDAFGKDVFQVTVPFSEQQRELPFDFSHFAPGVYFIQLKSASILQTEKWIKN